MKNNYENYAIYGLLVLVIFVLAFAVFDFSRTIGISDKEPSEKASANKYSPATESIFKSITTGSTNSGDVSIELTPYKLDNGQLKVNVAVNTHSVDLSPFDLKQITTLEYSGETVKPVSAPSLSGHHSNGELVFNIEKELNLFTIKIKSIPKVEERVFTWQI